VSAGGSPYLGIHAINVYVRDQERSLRFYLDQLGFHVAFDAKLPSGERWVAVAPPDAGAVLALIAPKRGSLEHKLIGRATQVVFVTEDVLGRFREWSSRGVRFRHAPRLGRVAFSHPGMDTRKLTSGPPVWGGVFTRFEDPDRNSFQLVSFDEVSRAFETRRREAAEKLEAERRAAQEMDIARQVQARLFPQTLPPVSTLEYAGACIQAREVGGDYYDFLDLGQGRLGLVIGDIAGKGIAAALLMANLQANLRSQCAIALDQPERLLRSVNQLFHDNTDESAYATLFFAVYDDSARRLRYANCGHLPGLILHGKGGIDRLQSTCTVVGLFEEWDCATGDCELRAGDTLALYTDGVTESFNEAGEDFGEARLIETLLRHRAKPPKAMVGAVVDEVRQFSAGVQHDDITLMIAAAR